MKSRAFVLRTLAVLAIILGITFGLTSGSLARMQTPGHSDHHGGTPTSGSACGPVATPGAGQSNMGMDATPGGMMNMGATPAGGMMMNMEFDLAFIDMMIPHHEGAVAMAKVALERGEHEEIRAMAEEIISAQDTEITQLQAWRTAWYPDAPLVTMSGMMDMQGMGHMMPGMSELMDSMSGMHMDPAADTAALCAVGDAFDRAFIDMMIPHHESAIMMAETALQHAQHPELKEMAKEIIDAQQREIDQMKGWREAWYGETPAGTPAASSPSVVLVALTEFSVTASQTEFHVGQPYKFIVSNGGAIPHELMLLPEHSGIGQKTMEELHHVALAVVPVENLSPGLSQEVEVTFSEPGRYELACALPGHYGSGMTLAVTVSA